MPTYRIEEGSLHERFLNSRAKIRIFGGGFGNGKTAVMNILAIILGEQYPGANILMARATYPKLQDTVLKEFKKWVPEDEVASFPKAVPPTCTMKNGTMYNFRYVQQQKSRTSAGEQSSSNLLSANYDAIFVDQIEDVEITHKDFLDLLGRLRGQTTYDGEDPTMPKSGPRWMILTCNPTRGWVYKELIKPLHAYQKSGNPDDLGTLWDKQRNCPLIELFEGPTYINKALEQDFIDTLEATYKGQMRDRYLLGQWAAYEGLVYPNWNAERQMVPHQEMFNWFIQNVAAFGRTPEVFEGYDYGLAVPSCYGFFFADVDGNINLLDGFYAAETPVALQAKWISEIRNEYLRYTGLRHDDIQTIADPAIFRRQAGQKRNVVGKSIAQVFAEDEKCPINMQPGDNDIINGIARVNAFMTPHDYHVSPYDRTRPAPHFYVSDKLEWFEDEIGGYMWHKDSSGESTDKPVDKDDHAMDMLKLALNRDIKVPAPVSVPKYAFNSAIHAWRELDDDIRRQHKKARYG